jgi:hypothetical protein
VRWRKREKCTKIKIKFFNPFNKESYQTRLMGVKKLSPFLEVKSLPNKIKRG